MTKPEIFYTGPIVKRAEAKAEGEMYYFTGKPCKRGHIDKRRVSDHGCVECGKVKHKRTYVPSPEPIHDNISVHYSGPLISRAEAIKNGEKVYFTGKPCKHGHVAQRFVCDHSCRECGRLYLAAMRDVYPDRGKEYYWANREACLESSNKWFRDNRDAQLKKKKEWRERNPGHSDEYRKKNPELYAEASRRRRARKLGADGYHSKDDIDKILSGQGGLCAAPWCRSDISNGYEIDHIMPLSRGGSDWPSNLQCLCRGCNRSKSSKTMDEWCEWRVILGLPIDDV